MRHGNQSPNPPPPKPPKTPTETLGHFGTSQKTSLKSKDPKQRRRVFPSKTEVKMPNFSLPNFKMPDLKLPSKATKVRAGGVFHPWKMFGMVLGSQKSCWFLIGEQETGGVWHQFLGCVSWNLKKTLGSFTWDHLQWIIGAPSDPYEDLWFLRRKWAWRKVRNQKAVGS